MYLKLFFINPLDYTDKHEDLPLYPKYHSTPNASTPVCKMQLIVLPFNKIIICWLIIIIWAEFFYCCSIGCSEAWVCCSLIVLFLMNLSISLLMIWSGYSFLARVSFNFFNILNSVQTLLSTHLSNNLIDYMYAYIYT